MKKILLAIICIIVILIAPLLGTAETIILKEYTVEAGYFEGEPAILIQYEYNGEIHAFAWDEPIIQTGKPIWIEVLPNGHTYDANYYEGGKENDNNPNNDINSINIHSVSRCEQNSPIKEELPISIWVIVCIILLTLFILIIICGICDHT